MPIHFVSSRCPAQPKKNFKLKQNEPKKTAEIKLTRHKLKKLICINFCVINFVILRQ